MERKNKKVSGIDYDVTTPIEKKDGKTFWLRIGAGWEKEEGISINLSALPIGGQLFIAPHKEKEKEDEKIEG